VLADDARLRAGGLLFPEGPVALPGGDVLVCQLAGESVVRVAADGEVSELAQLGGGPNGAAIGPDGRLYVVNAGDIVWSFEDGRAIPSSERAAGYTTGSVQAVDLESGEFETLFTDAEERPLSAPNDIVFDAEGGFYFTDIGKPIDHERASGWLYYARPGDERARVAAGPLVSPNGVGLSPDGSRLYVAETLTGRLWMWEIDAPGRLRAGHTRYHPGAGTLLCTLPGYGHFDSLAVDAEGHICVATLFEGAITVFRPDGTVEERVTLPVDEPFVTNICFGGPELRTAWITGSEAGQLWELSWPWQGMAPNFAAPA
jgi:gluconolactonase